MHSLHTLAFTLTCVFFFPFAVYSQASPADSAAIVEVSMKYIDGFIDGDADLLAESISTDLYKFGFRWNADSARYEHAGVLTFDSATELAKRIGENGGRRDPKAPQEVEILDIQGPIANVKVRAIWGIDYMLLAKGQNSWKIEQVLWTSMEE